MTTNMTIRDMTIPELPESMELLNLTQPMKGYNPFVGSWILPGDPFVIFDVGPKCSIDVLLNHLKNMGVDKVDYILLSHIHIDHAGGVGHFLDVYPMAKVVAHDKGIRHLADPEKLWQGALTVLRDVARSYGKMKPVPREALIPHTEARIPGMTIIETPGHAPHHLSYVFKDTLIAGEAAGIYLPFIGPTYLRPPTPPRFILDIAVSSVDRLLALPDMPICYAHWGANKSSREMLATYRDQLYLWRDIIADVLNQGDGDDILKRCRLALLERDPALKAFPTMDEDTRAREDYYLENSAWGYVEFLREAGAK